MGNTEPVRVTLNVEAHPTTTHVEIDRAKWDAMTPQERGARLDELAHEAMLDAGGYGWSVEDPADAGGVL